MIELRQVLAVVGYLVYESEANDARYLGRIVRKQPGRWQIYTIAEPDKVFRTVASKEVAARILLEMIDG